MESVLCQNSIVLGRIISPYGVRGWVKIRSYTEEIEGLMSYQPLWVDKGGLKPLIINYWQVHGDGLIAHIEGVNNREKASFWCKRNILIGKDALPRIHADEYYWHELIGLRIKNIFADRDEDLGVVMSMLATGSNDVLLVSGDQASLDSRERLIPFIKEYVCSVNQAHGYIQVNWDPAF